MEGEREKEGGGEKCIYGESERKKEERKSEREGEQKERGERE